MSQLSNAQKLAGLRWWLSQASESQCKAFYHQAWINFLVAKTQHLRPSLLTAAHLRYMRKTAETG